MTRRTLEWYVFEHTRYRGSCCGLLEEWPKIIVERLPQVKNLRFTYVSQAPTNPVPIAFPLLKLYEKVSLTHKNVTASCTRYLWAVETRNPFLSARGAPTSLGSVARPWTGRQQAAGEQKGIPSLRTGRWVRILPLILSFPVSPQADHFGECGLMRQVTAKAESALQILVRPRESVRANEQRGIHSV